MSIPGSSGFSSGISYLTAEKQRRAEFFQSLGILVQTIAFILNFVIWVISICALIYGIMVGLGTKTIRVDDYNILDWFLVTPATLFLYYGVPLLIVATWGWFAIVTAYLPVLICYVILLLGFFLYDNIYMISFLTSQSSYDKFLSYTKQSLSHYGERNPPGIFGVHPTTYWDHLQSRGSCCGWTGFEDWETHTMSIKNDLSIPDSCCNEHYGYKGCGFLLWDHPDHEQHTMETILHDKGCLMIFPAGLRADTGFFWSMGLCVLLLMIALTILSLILILLTQMGFERNTGVNNANFLFVPAEPPIMRACRSSRIHPEDCCAYNISDRDDSCCDERRILPINEKC